jgi:eukaryotic-like serine/threonine-protein kinase
MISPMAGEGGHLPEAGANFGKYRIVRKMGAGAFGVVYEALIPGPMGFSKQVALKMIRSQVGSDEQFVKSMINEARLGGVLHHSNIVDVIEFDQIGHDYFLAMEYVDGATLEEIIGVCQRREVVLPRFAVLDIALQVCRGLQYAHDLKDRDGRSLDLIHRDLKPSNIMLDRQGTAKILDFGIAKAASNLPHSTLTGTIKGTPRYMSPDQLLGEGPLTPSSDVFSFGVVLYELITGRPLFTGTSLTELLAALMQKDLGADLDRAQGMFPGIQPVLERMLSRDTETRYPDIRSVANDLRPLALEYPVTREMADVLAAMFPQVDRSEILTIEDTHALRNDISAETRAYSAAEASSDLQQAETMLAQALQSDAEPPIPVDPPRRATPPPQPAAPTPPPQPAAPTPAPMLATEQQPPAGTGKMRLLVVAALVGLSLLVVVLAVAVVVMLAMMS